MPVNLREYPTLTGQDAKRFISKVKLRGPECPQCGTSIYVVEVDKGEPYGYYRDNELVCLKCGEFFYEK